MTDDERLLVRQENWKNYEAVFMLRSGILGAAMRRRAAVFTKLADLNLEAGRCAFAGEAVPLNLEILIARTKKDVRKVISRINSELDAINKLDDLFIELYDAETIWSEERIDAYLLDRVGVVEADIRSCGRDLQDLAKMMMHVQAVASDARFKLQVMEDQAGGEE